MPLNLTKIAFGAQSYGDIENWYAARRSPNLTTRYRPTKWEECIGGSLYWIHQHSIVARSEILGFSETSDGRWSIDLKPELVRVHPRPSARIKAGAISRANRRATWHRARTSAMPFRASWRASWSGWA